MENICSPSIPNEVFVILLLLLLIYDLIECFLLMLDEAFLLLVEPVELGAAIVGVGVVASAGVL